MITPAHTCTEFVFGFIKDQSVNTRGFRKRKRNLI